MSDSVNLPGMERRQHDRKIMRSVGVLELQGQAAVQVRVLDIGIGGVGVLSTLNPKPNTAAVIHLNVPVDPWENKAVRLQATVAHSVLSGRDGGFKIGLQFVALPDSVAKLIEAFIKG